MSPAKASRPAPEPEAMQGGESPLAWLRNRSDRAGEPMIDAPSFAAGERLRLDFTMAAGMGHVTMNWGGLGGPLHRANGSDAAGPHAAATGARERLARALTAVGPEFGAVLVEVCCEERGLVAVEQSRAWPPRSAKVVLKLALSALARHYGFANPAVGRASSPITRWGTPDYRPRA